MSKITRDFEEIIHDFVPENAGEEIIRLWQLNPFRLTITGHRKTKKGDFKANIKGKVHYISVNGTLNPYEFLLVLIHEYAHLMVWKKFGRTVKPHGIEWKIEFQEYMLPFFELVEFPPRLAIAMLKYLKNPKAASSSDIPLQKEFSKFDAPSDKLVVEDLENGALFVFNNRLFKREKKLRARYLCEEISSRRKYRFSALAPVDLYQPE